MRHMTHFRRYQRRDFGKRGQEYLEVADLLNTRLDDDCIALDAFLFVERETDIFRFVRRSTTRSYEHERVKSVFLSWIYDAAVASLEDSFFQRVLHDLHSYGRHLAFE